jgi:serine/threonine-protein kinase
MNRETKQERTALPLDVLDQIDRICNRFEATWEAGQRPRLEDYLGEVAEPYQPDLLCDLLAVELDARRRRGERPEPHEYRDRFLGETAVVMAAFASPPISPARSGAGKNQATGTEVTAAHRAPGIGPDSVGAMCVDEADPGRTEGGVTGERDTLSAPGDPKAPTIGGTGDSLGMTETVPTIPGYEVLGELGRGGMGVVYQARQVRLNRAVAVKMILAGQHAGTEAAVRFLAEAEAIAKLQHPNIVQIFHIDEHAGFPYFEMEYVGGGNLADRLDGTPRSPREAAALIQALAGAMAEAHRQGIVHRDLKPGNILLTPEGVPKVADFGLAKLLNADSGLTRTDSVLGSPSYMAPEQAGGKAKYVGPAADVYALGAILYELLTGRPPFRGATVLETLEQVKTAEPVPPSRLVPGLPRDVETISLKCLQKDPDKRYESALALVADLRRFQAGEPIVARPVGQLERGWRWCRRNPVVAGLMAVASTFLIAGVAAVMAVQAKANRERSEAVANRAAREARTTATIAAAIREARERMIEAWRLTEDPARMQESTGAAIAALRPADESAAVERLSIETRDELAAARRDVEDLARHTRLLVAGTANRWRIADELNGQNVRQAQADFCTRQREAFARFGLEPLAGPVEEAARTVSASRIRDLLLGMLLEWRRYAAEPGMNDRLGQVVGATRRSSGGAHARWQELLDRKDVTGLVAFSRSPDALAFSASLADVLGRDLSDTRQLPACLAYLRAATDRYPQDAWLHYDLYYYRSYRQPAEQLEALRHIAAACVLRPDSALFHLRLGNCYSKLGAYDLAVQSCLKSIALYPKSSLAYQCLGRALAKKKDEKGAIAALQEALCLNPNDPLAIRSFARGQRDFGRTAEALRTLVDALGRSPSSADDPRLYLRYDAVCAYLICADGEDGNAPPPADRVAYRKQAFDLLTAEFAAIRKLATADPTFAHEAMQLWFADKDLASVRDPKAVEQLPRDERAAWKELWAEVRDLRDRSAP